jgi:lysophospholipase
MSGLAAPLRTFPEVSWRGGAEWVTAADGARLRAALFPARGEARGSVVVSPGRTEPIEKYAEVVAELQARGFTTLVHDWRGQGLSDRFGRIGSGSNGLPLGHARGWRLFLQDLSRVLDVFALRLPRPWLGLGHSMGGGLTLLAMTEGEERLAGAVLSAPMLGLRLGGRPEWLVRGVAGLMTLAGCAGRASPPASPRPRGVEPRGGEVLTHDRERWARFQTLLDEAPELRLGETTWGWVQFALALTRRIEVLPGLERVEAPIVIVGAERDLLVAEEPQRAAAARLPNGRYVEVPGAFHEILMETNERRAVFWRAFDELAQKVGT